MEAPATRLIDEDDEPGGEFDGILADIGSANAVHDLYQYEATFDFDLRSDAEAVEKAYDIDMYFYLPSGMGIDGNTYSRDQFYADLTSYLRIKTPGVEAWERTVPEDWQLPILEKYFAVHLRGKQRAGLKASVIQETKLFGCLMNTSLKTIMDAQRPFEREPHRPGLRAMLAANRRRLEAFHAILRKYRGSYLRTLREEAVLVDEDVRRALLLIDEYLSYRLETCLIRMARFEAADAERLLREETAYRQQASLIYIDGDAARAEAFAYRLSLLKKYVSEVLFLHTENIKKEKLYRNLVASAGAGVAACFAALADFQRMALMNSPDVAYRVVLVVVIGILAYVFKDRIKDIAKEYFNERLKRFLPDLDVRMSYVRHEADGKTVKTFLGVGREFFRYLKPAALPAEIAYIRNLGHRDDLDPERKEVVMHYFKRLRFDRTAVAGDRLGDVRFIKEVARFDMHNFLAKLSDPKKGFSYFHADAGIQHVDAPKVYHVNVVYRYAVRSTDAQGRTTERVEFERVRIVLDKHGIVRAEPVVPRGELGYREEINR